jgi:crossover junction endodeoxyribonuclease RuvC
VLGIDPGKSGAIAFIYDYTPDQVTVEDAPLVANEINVYALTAIIREYAPDAAMIEHVASMPKQGVRSVFSFGLSYGMVRGVIAALDIPLQFVTPGKWKKHFSLSSDKEDARKRAIHMFPGCAKNFSRKKDHGRAEAALIARYCLETSIRKEVKGD